MIFPNISLSKLAFLAQLWKISCFQRLNLLFVLAFRVIWNSKDSDIENVSIDAKILILLFVDLCWRNDVNCLSLTFRSCNQHSAQNSGNSWHHQNQIFDSDFLTDKLFVFYNIVLILNRNRGILFAQLNSNTVYHYNSF